MVLAATTIAFLVNPNNPAFSPEGLLREQTEASALGIRLLVLNASTPSDIEHIFTTLAEQRVVALLVGPETFFNTQSAQLVALATRYAIPTSYARPEAVEIGGLISYSADSRDAFRNTGRYVGRILNGEKPGD